MTTIPFCMYVVFRCCKYVYRETAQLSEPGSRLWNCRCHGARNLQRHATVREVSRDARSTVSEAVPLDKVWQSHGVEDCFSMIMIASLFLFGKWPWQVGKVVRENMPPSRFVQLRRGRNRSVLHFKMHRDASKCCLVFALREVCEQCIIVTCLLWIARKNKEWIGIRNE